MHWRIYSYLSLDVVVGSLVSGMLFADVLGANMHWTWYIALPLAVWIVYTADHLLDARRLGAEANTPRHLFHHEHFNVIGLFWFVCLGIIILLIFFMPVYLILCGVFVGFFSGLHLALVKWAGSRLRWWLHKELGVALVYTMGVCCGPLFALNGGILNNSWGIILQFFLLALINLWLFSYFERDTDRKDGHTSFLLLIGDQTAKLGLVFMGLICLSIGIAYLLSGHYLPMQLIFFLMLLTLALIFYFPSWSLKGEKYRIWGDAVFIFPILHLLFV